MSIKEVVSLNFVLMKIFAIRPSKKKNPVLRARPTAFFPFLNFFFKKKKFKISCFWTKISMKNCERSEQEKIMILTFSGNFEYEKF